MRTATQHLPDCKDRGGEPDTSSHLGKSQSDITCPKGPYASLQSGGTEKGTTTAQVPTPPNKNIHNEREKKYDLAGSHII